MPSHPCWIRYPRCFLRDAKCRLLLQSARPRSITLESLFADADVGSDVRSDRHLKRRRRDDDRLRRRRHRHLWRWWRTSRRQNPTIHPCLSSPRHTTLIAIAAKIKTPSPSRTIRVRHMEEHAIGRRLDSCPLFSSRPRGMRSADLPARCSAMSDRRCLKGYNYWEMGYGSPCRFGHCKRLS